MPPGRLARGLPGGWAAGQPPLRQDGVRQVHPKPTSSSVITRKGFGGTLGDPVLWQVPRVHSAWLEPVSLKDKDSVEGFSHLLEPPKGPGAVPWGPESQCPRSPDQLVSCGHFQAWAQVVPQPGIELAVRFKRPPVPSPRRGKLACPAGPVGAGESGSKDDGSPQGHCQDTGSQRAGS